MVSDTDLVSPMVAVLFKVSDVVGVAESECDTDLDVLGDALNDNDFDTFADAEGDTLIEALLDGV